jgi:DNA double-strand break repair helicase HerA and related ATPase
VVEQIAGNSAVKSMLRSVGTQIGREITRSLFGTARRRR